MKHILISLFFLTFSLLLHAADITSHAVTGNWHSPSTWVGGQVPTANDSVIIVNGADITLTGDASAYKLRISSGGILNMGSHTLSLNGSAGDHGSITIYGTLNLNSGLLTLTGDFFTGTSAYPGTFNAGTGTVNFTGNEHQMIYGHTQPAFHNFITSNTNNALQKGLTGHPVNTIITGDFTANGVFNRASQNNYDARVTFDGHTTLSGAYSFFLHHIIINAGATLNAADKNIYLFGNWENNGTFICGTGTIFFLYDPNHPSQPNQTIVNINADSNPFNNIFINKTTGSVSPLPHPADAANPQGHIWVNGHFTVNNGTWNNGARQLWVKGDFIVNSGAVYNAGTGRLIMHGNTQQLLNTSSNTLYKFTVDNSSGGIQLVSDVEITHELALDEGLVFTTEAYQVHVSTTDVNAITSYSANGFIVGRLQRNVTASANNYFFPIGPMHTSPAKYRPVVYEQSAAGGATTISMIGDTIPWAGTYKANWYVRIKSDTGNPSGHLLFSYNITEDFPSNVNECSFSVIQGTQPMPANWNNILTTTTGASGGNSGTIRATLPGSLHPFAFIIGEAAPVVNNTSICNGTTATLNVISPTGSGSYNWYDAPSGGTLLQGNSTSYTTPVLTATTTYYVAHENSTTSCIGHYMTPVTVDVGINMNVNIIPSGPTAICLNDDIDLDAGSGYSSYIWSTGENTQSITVSTPNTYAVTVSDSLGCTGSGAITVTVVPPPYNAGAISGPSSLCVGNNGTFSIAPVTGATSYQWDVPAGFSITNGQGSPTVVIASYASGSGYITVTPINACGSGGASSLNIMSGSYPPAPQPIAGPTSVCSGEIATYTIPYVQGATGYTWSVPQGAQIVSGQNTNSVVVDWDTANTGVITVVPYNDCGNGNATSVYVTVSHVPPGVAGTISGPIEVCQGDTAIYTISPVNDATGYLWELPPGISVTGGQNTTTISVDWSQVITGFVIVTPVNSCGLGISDSLLVTVLPSPTAPVLDDTVWVCKGDSLEIINQNILPDQAVLWYEDVSSGTPFFTGDTLLLTNITNNETFWVETQNTDNCVNTGGRASVTVMVNPEPPIELTSNISGNVAILGQTIVFTASPDTYPEYTFMINGIAKQTGPAHVFTSNILKDKDVVSVFVKDSNGCIAFSNEIVIDMSLVPNAFTPDGDGINDIFMEGYDLTILNRWGQELYKGFDGWDGKYKGSDVSQGTYFYIITISDANENKSTITGAVVLTRN